MKFQSLTALLIVMAILLVLAVASQVFVEDIMEPTTLFGTILAMTAFSGIISTIVVEKINAKVFI